MATQDPRRTRGLVVEDKAARVYNYQRNTVAELQQLLASLGLDHPSQLTRSLLMRRLDSTTVKSYAEIHRDFEAGELLTSFSPSPWHEEWDAASANAFGTRR